MEEAMLSSTKEDLQLEKARSRLKSIILENGLLFGQGLDKDNNPYKWVFDTKSFLLKSDGLGLATLLLSKLIEKYRPDAVAGSTLASHILASSIACSSIESGKRIDALLIRKQRKEYNMAKLIEGPLRKNSGVVVVDDILNEFGSAKKSIEALEKEGCKVDAVAVLINFEKKEYHELKSRGCNVESIFTLVDFGLDTEHKAADRNMYKFKWKYGTLNATDYTAPKSSPIVDDSRIYVGSDQGKMVALDFNGNLLWEFSADYHEHGIHSSPIIADGKLIFSGYDGTVYALNKDDGSLLWKNRISSYCGSSPVYDASTNLVYIGTENSTLKGTLAALDADNGILEWEFSTNGHVPCRPAAGNDDIVVFGSNDGFVYACRKTDGKFAWKFRALREVKGRITIDDGLCYACSHDGFLYCIGMDGSLVWKRKLGHILYSEPVVFGQKVIIGSYSGQISALDKKSGKILWHFATKGVIQSYPSCCNGIVYFGSGDRCLYSVEAENGKLLWKFETKGAITSSPCIQGNLLLASSNDGQLYCFERT